MPKIQMRLLLSLPLLALASCSIKIKVPEIKSTQTELEHQIMGDYSALDDDLIFVSTVRDGEDKRGYDAAMLAKQNQKFNQDDLDELKTAQVIGEKATGLVDLVPEALSRVASVEKTLSLAKLIVAEENRDRAIIWQATLKTQKLAGSELGKVQKEYASLKKQEAKVGHWLCDEKNKWSIKNS